MAENDSIFRVCHAGTTSPASRRPQGPNVALLLGGKCLAFFPSPTSNSNKEKEEQLVTLMEVGLMDGFHSGVLLQGNTVLRQGGLDMHPQGHGVVPLRAPSFIHEYWMQQRVGCNSCPHLSEANKSLKKKQIFFAPPGHRPTQPPLLDINLGRNFISFPLHSCPFLHKNSVVCVFFSYLKFVVMNSEHESDPPTYLTDYKLELKPLFFFFFFFFYLRFLFIFAIKFIWSDITRVSNLVCLVPSIYFSAYIFSLVTSKSKSLVDLPPLFLHFAEPIQDLFLREYETTVDRMQLLLLSTLSALLNLRSPLTVGTVNCGVRFELNLMRVANLVGLIM
ncbi:hypothetical protein VP01_502g1 [Puccinia sorghi]|uniref:Uncharacterized protein n=1 Tax=Puccinia sorghi TaxID=27349 RepID=A0A0L6UNL3_9BASI|nr:hypothetical protein VP01_502g1 [Puccinia sorghi]